MKSGENRYKCLLQLFKIEEGAFSHLIQLMNRDKHVRKLALYGIFQIRSLC